WHRRRCLERMSPREPAPFDPLQATLPRCWSIKADGWKPSFRRTPARIKSPAHERSLRHQQEGRRDYKEGGSDSLREAVRCGLENAHWHDATGCTGAVLSVWWVSSAASTCSRSRAALLVQIPLWLRARED